MNGPGRAAGDEPAQRGLSDIIGDGLNKVNDGTDDEPFDPQDPFGLEKGTDPPEADEGMNPLPTEKLLSDGKIAKGKFNPKVDLNAEAIKKNAPTKKPATSQSSSKKKKKLKKNKDEGSDFFLLFKKFLARN